MVPIKKIEDLISKHALLETELSTGKVDKKLFAEKSKEYSDLNEIINDAKKYISFEKDKDELKKILEDQSSDKEILKMAKRPLILVTNDDGINAPGLRYLVNFMSMIGDVIIVAPDSPKACSSATSYQGLINREIRMVMTNINIIPNIDFICSLINEKTEVSDDNSFSI